jgi:hypothetical protein
MGRLSGGGGSRERNTLCQEQGNIRGNSVEYVVFTAKFALELSTHAGITSQAMVATVPESRE